MKEDGIACIVVRQLLDTIDNLQQELEKEKRAQCDADMCLIQATHKRPQPQSPLADDREKPQQVKRLRGMETGRNTGPPRVTHDNQAGHSRYRFDGTHIPTAICHQRNTYPNDRG
jgi:hypothetical protein